MPTGPPVSFPTRSGAARTVTMSTMTGRRPYDPETLAEHGLRPVGTTPPLGEYLRQLWERREFILAVPMGRLRAENQDTVLGSAWHLLNPLLLAGVYYLLFGVLFDAARRVEAFPAFLLIGVMTYRFVSKALVAGGQSVVNSLPLIRSIQFPRAALPLATVIGEAIAHVPALIAMMVLVTVTTAWSDAPLFPDAYWLLVLPATVVMTMFGLGLALLTSRATFHFRDVQNLLPFVLRLWMYLSGMLFPIEFVIEKAGERQWLVTLFEANPLYELFTMFRGALGVLDERFDPTIWLAATAWALAVLLLGFVYFRAHETEYGRG